MESSNSCLVVKNGGGIIMKQLPIGFRFRPTDEELLIHYLRRKVFSLPLPASIVPDHIDLFRTHPSHLPGDLEEKRYFFSKRINYSGYNRKGNVMNNRLLVGEGSGYWKVIGKSGKVILAHDPSGTSINQAVGLKRCLVFYQRINKQHHSHALKTRWIMHEFRLLGTLQDCTTLVEMGDWVVCRIYQKKKKKKYQPKNHGAGAKTHQSISNNRISETSSFSVETLPSSNLMMMELEEVEDDGTNGIGPPQDYSSSGITN